MRRLIVNADDFGLTHGVNRGIVEASKNGVVTSTTLMASGPAFSEAVCVAQSVPQLSVGCHVLLVDGSPILDADRVSSLIAARDRTDRARFFHGFGGLAVRGTSGKLVPEQIEAEATAQIRKLQAAGVRVSHLDTHKHTHMLPQVLAPLLRAATACGVGKVRNPFEFARLSLLTQRAGMWKRLAQVKILGSLAGKFRKEVRQAGMLTPDGTFGVVSTGWLDERLLKFMIEHLAEGTWELVCHPGYNDQDLEQVRTGLRVSRERELQLLGSSQVRKLLEDAGIELISYAQFGE